MRKPNGGYTKINIELPEDRGILLRDILESGVVDKEKAYCLKHQAGNARDYLKKHHTQVAFEPVILNRPHGFNKGGVKKDKSPTLTANGNWQHNNYLCEPVCVAQRGRYIDSGNRHTKCNGPTEQFYEARTDGKTNALTTVQKDNNVAEPTDNNSKATPIYEVRNGFINHNGQWYPIKLADGFYIIRKLSVRECCRLQTVPEWYYFPVSDTQAYKMLGNGWTVEVIAHLMRYIKVIEAFSV